MSSKQPTYLQLTRANYEEAFLLYVDGELDPAAMDAVEAFAAHHPDLQEELELLLETRLDAEPLSFGDLDALKADGMRRLTREEDLLSYIDNELTAPQRKSLEADLTADPALRAELALLQAAKLPADKVVCPFTEELYRREEKRRPLFWLPRVAAAVLLIGAGALLWSSNTGGDPGVRSENGTAVAVTQANSEQKVPSAVQPAATAATPPATATLASATELKEKSTDRISTVNLPVEKRVDIAQEKVPAKNRGELQPAPQPVPEQQYAYVPDPRDRTPSNALDAQPANTTLGDPAVTSPAVAALNPQSNDAQPVATEAVYREEGRQTSVRGFLRKASRFLEKRTGIKTTNEDNQLVVGGVAINLK